MSRAELAKLVAEKQAAGDRRPFATIAHDILWGAK